MKKLLPHAYALLFFVVLAFIYCSPVLQGQVPKQLDIQQATAMQHEINQYRDAAGNTPFWTNAMFSGMPTFQIGGNFYRANFGSYVIRLFSTVFPNPVYLIFLFLAGAYLLFITLSFEVPLAVAAAIAAGFTTYNFVLIEAGHNNQTLAIAFFAPVLAGALLTFTRKGLLGSILFSFFLAVEIRSSHLQMSYYLMLFILVMVTALGADALRKKKLPAFIRSAFLLAAGTGLAVLVNCTSLLINKEFAEETIRGGKSELGTQQGAGGLSKDYVYAWSQGIGESITFFVPNAFGGSSSGQLDGDSESAKALLANNAPTAYLQQLPTYWGSKPFTSGPIYFGAEICFLFVLGLFLVQGPLKWGLLAAASLSLTLSWGKYFQTFSDLFYTYFPLYNKFRSVESILVIAGLAVPMLALLGFKQLPKQVKSEDLIKLIRNITLAFAGVLLVFIVTPGLLFDFKGASDGQLPNWLQSSLIADRTSMLRKDGLRSLFFVLSTAALAWAIITGKVRTIVSYYMLAALILIDLWMVDKRYLNDERFVPKSEIAAGFVPRPVDEEILKDKGLSYRVLDLSVDTYKDAMPSYYHKTVGGYNAAKLRRYQELIENQLSNNNIKVLNMLNTRYVIVPDSTKTRGGQPGLQVQRNPDALGNAWLVNSIKWAKNASEEMSQLTNFDPKNEAIVDKRFRKEVESAAKGGSTEGSIQLVSYHPDDMVYSANLKENATAVFSEIYYNKGWKAFVDGAPATYFRANYVLRAMNLPKGIHRVEWKFRPALYDLGEKISFISSLVLIILLIFVIYQRLTTASIPK